MRTTAWCIIGRLMTSAQVIVLATPVFLLLIGAEFVVGWRRGLQTYRWADALSSIGLGMISPPDYLSLASSAAVLISTL